MAMFQVFVEGPVDRSPEGLSRLAEAMHQRYGLPVADLIARMSKGRFRVKSNLDPTTASAYARDLERIGARVVLEAVDEPAGTASGAGSRGGSRATPVAGVRAGGASSSSASRPTPAAGVRAATPPAGARAATPPAGARTATPPAGARTAAPPAGSRTAAPPAGARAATPAAGARTAAPPAGSRAGADELSVENLGDLDSSLLVLASDDGRGAAPAPASSMFEPPGTFDLPGTFDAPGTFELAGAFEPPASPAKSPPPKDVPLDLFEAPDAGDGLAVELAPDEMAHQARKRVATPLPLPAPPDPDEPDAFAKPVHQRRSQPAIESPRTPAIGPPQAPAIDPPRAAMPRARFAAGVVLAVVLGFVPAHFVASVRERSAFREIDAHVVEVQSRTEAPLDGAALDAFRAEQKDRKQSRRRSIALGSLAIWAVLGGGLAYVWFRRIPWDRLGPGR